MYTALAGEEAAGVKTMAQVAKEYEANIKAGLTEKWVETGIGSLDSWVTIRRKNQVVVAGNPSTGKSSFALQTALHAMKTNHVLFISLEMSEEELFERVIQGMTGCSAKVIANPRHTGENNQEKIAKAMAKVRSEHHTLHLLSPGMVTPQDVMAHARSIQIRYGSIGLVVVDYIQLMHCPLKNMGTTERTTWLSRQMKAVCRQLDVPILVLSQLSRDNTRGNREPELHDLRDSGALEQDADIVIFTHRQNLEEEEGLLLVKKQRHGPTGRTRVKFDGRRSRFLAYHPTD
jgi:replicative DNA helicase